MMQYFCITVMDICSGFMSPHCDSFIPIQSVPIQLPLTASASPYQGTGDIQVPDVGYAGLEIQDAATSSPSIFLPPPTAPPHPCSPLLVGTGGLLWKVLKAYCSA